MLSLTVFLPLLAAALLCGPWLPSPVLRWGWVVASALELALVGVLWARYDTPAEGTLAFETRVPWIPGVASDYHVGLDGLSLPLVAMTAVVFLAAALYSLRDEDRPRSRVAVFLALETVCLGTFAAADLVLFFVFFDLSIVGMYLVIAGWGHGDRARSALLFFLYTFLGSLALLGGFIGLYVASDPHTFDMVELARQDPFAGGGTAAAVVLGAILLGLAVKTPTVPFHTWLPPAHTDAPAAGSAVLAGVLLKLGTYGFVRLGMTLLPDAWQAWAWVVLVVGLVSVLWGALVAMAQRDLKRLVAYTSVNHMGYVVLAVGAAGVVAADTAGAREVAVSGAVTQMVSHGLVTAALFLLAGVVLERSGTYETDRFGGLAGRAPRFTALFAVAAFASLGLPGLSGFVAELQIFAGSIAAVPWSAVGLLGILLVAGLLLWTLQRLVTGEAGPATHRFSDVRAHELLAVGPLLLLSLAIGLAPRPLLDVVEPAAAAVVAVLGR